MPATLAKQADIFQQAFASTRVWTGTHTFNSIYKNLRHAANFVQTEAFPILDSAPNRQQLILKEATHIRWENPTLNKQLNPADLTLLFRCNFLIR